MAEYDDDIDALIEFLATASQEPFYYTATHNAEKYHAALTALVAERDELRQRVAVLESQEFTLPRDPFRDPDRDLRERLLESALQGLGCRLFIMEESDAEQLGRQAAWIVNGALAEMRKEEADA